MSRNECVVFCVAIVSVILLLMSFIFAISVTASVKNLTEVLAQPGITDRIEVESLVLTNHDGVVLEFTNLDVEVNSRLLDLIMGAVAATQ